MAYVIALVLVGLFTVNVVIGAVGDAPVVGNVAEMLILFSAAISFSIAILRSEAKAASNAAHASTKDD